MTLFGINLLATLRQRLGAVLGAFGAAAACCACGALMTFVLAPGQAARAFNVSRMPVMDAAAVQAAAPGQAVLITGRLAGNPPALPGKDLVVYKVEQWTVRVSEGETGNREPSGRWESAGRSAPDLNLEVGGQPLQLLAATSVQLSGSLREELEPGGGDLTANYQGQPLADGSRRYEGLADGDLTTVLGQKAASGGVLPEHLYGGDRVAFEASQRQAASGLFGAGICAMAMAPVILVLGLLGAIFYRRR
jgi:hypothetical protein